jgi:putative colanic acid biosynthesis acetyltransferase WcaF
MDGRDLEVEDPVQRNRATQKWNRRELAGRFFWSLCRPLFSLSPRLFWQWRIWLLRLFGARIGKNVHIFPTVKITIPWNISIGDSSAIGDKAILYALGPISIGSQVTVSQGAHLCAGTHDWRDPAMPLLKPPITIGNGCWLCADVFKDVPSYAIAIGNPAEIVKSRH